MVAIVAAAAPVQAQQQLSLPDAIALAQKQSLQARAAVQTRNAARERDRAYSASLLPQVSVTGTVPSYNRSIIPVLQPDGSTLFRAQAQNQSSLTMRVAQTLPYLGGQMFFQSALSRMQIIGEHSTQTWSSTPYQVGITQSLLRSNTASWVAQENDITSDVAERQYLEAREDLAVATTSAFFDFYAAKVGLDNADKNVSSNDSLFALNKGRFEVGKIGENDLGQSELTLLRAQSSLDGAKLEYDRALAALRLQLNLPVGAPIDVTMTSTVPEFVPDTAIAVEQALRNSSLVRGLDLQAEQAQRRVSESKWNSGFGATVTASLGFNQTGSDVNVVYRDLLQAQGFTLSVSMPLVQWGGRSAQMAAARADQDRVAGNIQLAREQAVQDAHFAALQLSQASRQLKIAAKADTVAAARFDVAKNRYLIGKIGIDILVQAQVDKDAALLSYLQSLRGYWAAYYRLRRVTLYDFEAGKPIR
jgi:outer membrane protein TolC